MVSARKEEKTRQCSTALSGSSSRGDDSAPTVLHCTVFFIGYRLALLFYVFTLRPVVEDVFCDVARGLCGRELKVFGLPGDEDEPQVDEAAGGGGGGLRGRCPLAPPRRRRRAGRHGRSALRGGGRHGVGVVL